jgi:hypothetical protein
MVAVVGYFAADEVEEGGGRGRLKLGGAERGEYEDACPCGVSA